jgi:hypothetical protein
MCEYKGTLQFRRSAVHSLQTVLSQPALGKEDIKVGCGDLEPLYHKSRRYENQMEISASEVRSTPTSLTN